MKTGDSSAWSEKLSEHDWLFAQCPEDQRHWCDIYEHARDNKLAVETVALYRRSGLWADPGIFPDSCSNLLGKAFIDVFPEFPQRPFLSIRSEERQKRCRHLDRLRRHIHVRIYNDGRSRANSEGTVLLEIHRGAPRSNVLKALDRILKEGRGPQLPIERLNYLALARLFTHFDNWNSVRKHLEKVGSAMAAKDDSQFSKAKKKAALNIENVLHRIV